MKFVPALLFCMLTTAAVTAEQSTRLADVLALHAESAGPGLDALRAELSIEEPGFSVDGLYVARRDGRMRIDIYADGVRVFIEALDGADGWQWRGDSAEPEPLSDAGRAALYRGVVANLYGLHERPAQGYTLSYEGEAYVDGERYWQLRSVAPGGYTELLFLDPATGLVARKREQRALHPDADPRESLLETRYSDYRRVGGRMLSFRSETVDLDRGERLQQTRLRAAEPDPQPDAAYFRFGSS